MNFKSNHSTPSTPLFTLPARKRLKYDASLHRTPPRSTTHHRRSTSTTTVPPKPSRSFTTPSYTSQSFRPTTPPKPFRSNTSNPTPSFDPYYDGFNRTGSYQFASYAPSPPPQPTQDSTATSTSKRASDRSSAYTKVPSTSSQPAKQSSTFYAHPHTQALPSKKPNLAQSTKPDPTPLRRASISALFADLLSETRSPHPVSKPEPIRTDQASSKHEPTRPHQTRSKHEPTRTDQARFKPEPTRTSKVPEPSNRRFSNEPPRREDDLNRWREGVASRQRPMSYASASSYANHVPLFYEPEEDDEELYGIGWPPVTRQTNPTHTERRAGEKMKSNPQQQQKDDAFWDRIQSFFDKATDDPISPSFIARPSLNHPRSSASNVAIVDAPRHSRTEPPPIHARHRTFSSTATFKT